MEDFHFLTEISSGLSELLSTRTEEQVEKNLFFNFFSYFCFNLRFGRNFSELSAKKYRHVFQNSISFLQEHFRKNLLTSFKLFLGFRAKPSPTSDDKLVANLSELFCACLEESYAEQNFFRKIWRN